MTPRSDGRDLLAEWRSLMDSVIGAAASVGSRAEIPRTLIEPMERQLELVRQVIETGVAAQQQIARQALAPVDAIVDMVEDTGGALRRQADALESAANAMADAAAMVRMQAELFERTIRTFRQPADRARAAAGIERRAKSGRRAGRAPGP